MGSPELFRIFEVSDERGDFLLRHHACQQGPEGADGLDVRKRPVRKLVVVEGGLIVPQTLVDRQREPVTLVAQVRDLPGAAEDLCHPQEQVCREDLLEACVDPDGVTMVGQAFGPPELPCRSLREARLVIHSGAEAGRPVGAVAPGAVTPQPPVVGDENREDPPEAVTVSRVAVVLPLRPRQYVGACARRVEALEAVSTVEGVDLTADKPIGVLAGVEVIQGALEVEGAAAVAGEKQDEGRVPHEKALIECRVDKIRHEATLRLGTAQVGERQLPRPTVAIYGTLVAIPERLGQGIPYVLERGRWCDFRGHPSEGVLLDQRFPEMGVDVAVFRSQLADLLCSLIQHRAYALHAQALCGSYGGASRTAPTGKPRYQASGFLRRTSCSCGAQRLSCRHVRRGAGLGAREG